MSISRAHLPPRALRCMLEEPFRRIVFAGDPTLAFPDYTSLIAQPMFVERIMQRLDTGYYTEVKDVFADVHLVFENAIRFNAEKAPAWANEVRRSSSPSV
jgi:hypothetical protein